MATKKTQSKTVTPEMKARAVTAIVAPRITEKATALAEKGVYVFDVAPNTSKFEIKKAVEALYGKTPVKVAITRVPRKTVYRRGKVGSIAGGKKAVVYLAKGETIEII